MYIDLVWFLLLSYWLHVLCVCFFENMTYSLAGHGLVYVIDVDEHGFETLKIQLFLECFQNHSILFPELEPKKVRKIPWLPTLYFYITIVINKKKRSFDVLCIEIIVNVQS